MIGLQDAAAAVLGGMLGAFVLVLAMMAILDEWGANIHARSEEIDRDPKDLALGLVLCSVLVFFGLGLVVHAAGVLALHLFAGAR